MTEKKDIVKKTRLSRRDFFRSSAAVGLGAALAGTTLAAQSRETAPPNKTETPTGNKNPERAPELRVALIGAGEQGRVLLESCLRIPGIRIAAVCDIWSYSQQYARGYLRKYGQDPAVYENYQDLLAKEKGLAAAIVASPDWMHHEQANACMNAGLHVYCEKEMSNSLEKARTIVETARRAGRLCQIGHQRRSNPRYLHAIDRLIRGKKILGRVNLAYAQWNRSKADMLGWPKNYPIPSEKLQAYGYNTMAEFRNWRWFKKFGGGPIVDLGSHQIDLFSWVFGVNPNTVTASGGVDYYKGRNGTTTSWPSTNSRRRKGRPAPCTRSRQRPRTAASSRFSWEMTERSRSAKSRSAATGRCARPTRPNGIPWSRKGFFFPKPQSSRKSTPAISSSMSGSRPKRGDGRSP